ncbi:MAG TPA: hypothetical protein VIY70_07930 [Acidimicrobiia bacterium]
MTTPRRFALFALAVAILASGCGSGDASTVARAGDLGHIHDLVLEADGDLLVASHTGLYRIERTDHAVLVGDEQHDLMAMAAQADALIASGHPNLLMERYQVEGRPPFLGLVRSNDSGESWEIVDLLGDADFHALAPTPTGLFAAETTGRIWFLDETSGQWSQLGEVEARDLAVNPADPTQQLAPDYDAGVWASNDGAVTWTRLDTAPPLIEIEWESAQGIVGITVDGGVWVSDELEDAWTETAAFDSADEVETFYIDPNGNWWVTVHGGAIFHSTDAGATWDEAYDPPDRP